MHFSACQNQFKFFFNDKLSSELVLLEYPIKEMGNKELNQLYANVIKY